MNKLCVFFFLFCSFSESVFGQIDSLQVLFLGNSYTYTNNLPQLTENLATNAGKVLITDNHTPGGYTFEGHSTNVNSLTKIRRGGWDFIVLQEQSQIPTIPFYRDSSMYPSAKKLLDTIRHYNPCAKVLLYMTWGRKNGGQQCDNTGMNCSPIFQDFSHMQDSLETAYLRLANALNVAVAPVGISWKNVLQDTTIDLHSADESHPNYNGSFLAACTFHTLFWKESPDSSSFNGNLTANLSSYLKGVADTTVWNSLVKWNLNKDSVKASYQFSITGDTVFFTNQSLPLTQQSSFLWHFGDGDTSTLVNPYHVFVGNQAYRVQLRVEHCESVDTISQIIDLRTSGLTEDALSGIQYGPNPVENVLSIRLKQTEDFEVSLFTLKGNLMKRNAFEQQREIKLHLNNLPLGMYILQLKTEKKEKSQYFKVIKH